jgi:hypothetical protein
MEYILETLDGLQESLQGKVAAMDADDRTFYGRREIGIRDVNGFRVTFSADAGEDGE